MEKTTQQFSTKKSNNITILGDKNTVNLVINTDPATLVALLEKIIKEGIWKQG